MGGGAVPARLTFELRFNVNRLGDIQLVGNSKAKLGLARAYSTTRGQARVAAQRQHVQRAAVVAQQVLLESQRYVADAGVVFGRDAATRFGHHPLAQPGLEANVKFERSRETNFEREVGPGQTTPAFLLLVLAPQAKPIGFELKMARVHRVGALADAGAVGTEVAQQLPGTGCQSE